MGKWIFGMYFPVESCCCRKILEHCTMNTQSPQPVQMNAIFFHNVGILHLSFNVKTPKTSAKFSKKSRNKCGSNCFFMVFSVKSVLILTITVFFTDVQHKSGTRRIISWSVTVHSKNLSSQCNLTALIEQV